MAAPSSHAILRKKLEEVEAQVTDTLRSPIQHPYHDIAIYRIRSKVDFIKNLLAAENGLASARDSPDALLEMAGRLSVAERKFVGWASSGEAEAAVAVAVAAAEAENGLDSQGKAENTEEEAAERLSFIESNFTDLDSLGGSAPSTLCKYCLDNEEEDKGEYQEDEQELQEEEEEEEKARLSLGVTDEEKIRRELEVIREKIIAEVTEKVVKENRRLRRSGRRRRCVTVAVVAAAVAAVGLAIAGFGSGDESAYLVPT